MLRKRLAASDLLAQAEANGYKKGKHRELDKVRDRHKHVEKTKKDHEAALNRYVLWHLGHMERDCDQEGLPPPTEVMARQRFLGKGVEAPDLETVKDFLRFHISMSRGKIVAKPTADSVNAFAEWFFAGFTRVTGTLTDAQDRSEVYHWVRRTLTAEGLVVNRRREKHLFTLRDLTRLLLALWTQDDLIFIHERSRIQFTLIFRMYCWTGARLGAFFTGGLCYKDIDLVLQRVDTGGWRLIYQVKQRWVKNNRDPKNIHFGAVGKDHDKLIYNDAAFLLVLAIADDALFGYKSLDDVRRQEIPADEDQLIISYKETALDRPILRRCTKAEGVTEDPMPKATFLAIYEKSMKNAGYLCGTSIHAVRRQLGKKVDEKYSSVQRSQHLTQADPRVFGQSYVANCSSVDGQAAFLGEDLDHRHVDYFQSLEKFRELGLPCELPAYLEDRLRSDPRLCQMESEIRTLKRQEGSSSSLKEAKDRLVSYRKTLKRTTLRRYQQDWMRDRRDWKILTRGKQQVGDLCKTDLVRSLCLLIPERGRLALGMASDDPVSPAAMWRAMDDLHSLCTRNFTVLYLPGNEPDEDVCPVKCCRQEMNSLPKTQRNQHIQACVRREMASELKQLQSDTHYCHQCFQWVIGDGWEKHCQSHLQPITSKICGAVTYTHTLVRPGFCPFCLGNETLPANRRLESWTRDRKMWCHIREHLTGRQWPTRCPHPLCDISLEDEAALSYHFVDEHRITRTHASHPTETSTKAIHTATGTKHQRGLSQGHEALEWQTPEDFSVPLKSRSADCLLPLRSPEGVSSTSPTIYPSLISKAEDEVDTHSFQGDVQIVFKFDTNETTKSEDTSSHHWMPLRAGSEMPLEASISDESNDDAIFSQYLRSPSPCPSVRHFDHCVESLTTPMSATVPGNVQGKLQAVEYRPRIRLRVKPPTPRVVLRLSNPKPAGVVKRKRRA